MERTYRCIAESWREEAARRGGVLEREVFAAIPGWAGTLFDVRLEL